jgi:hypothetical protein
VRHECAAAARTRGLMRRWDYRAEPRDFNPGLVVESGCALKAAPEEGFPAGIGMQLETSPPNLVPLSLLRPNTPELWRAGRARLIKKH